MGVVEYNLFIYTTPMSPPYRSAHAPSVNTHKSWSRHHSWWVVSGEPYPYSACCAVAFWKIWRPERPPPVNPTGVREHCMYPNTQ